MKIDRRINYKIVLDCETAPCDKELDEVTPINMLAYDIGWVVCDKNGNVYAERSFVNADIFLDEKELMKSAYYAHKIPEYWEDIKAGRRTLTSFYNIHKALLDDIEMFEVEQIFAHNMRFDYGALNNTERWLTKSKYRYFFPYGVDICDTLKLSRQLIGTMPTYKKWCVTNGYMTKNNQPRLTAEIIYRFISGNADFEEEHKGLDDCMIEKEILAYCYRKHQKMEPKLWADRVSA
jgi:hypothetical protein